MDLLHMKETFFMWKEGDLVFLGGMFLFTLQHAATRPLISLLLCTQHLSQCLAHRVALQ